jgi:hypothetical protein
MEGDQIIIKIRSFSLQTLQSFSDQKLDIKKSLFYGRVHEIIQQFRDNPGIGVPSERCGPGGYNMGMQGRYL